MGGVRFSTQQPLITVICNLLCLMCENFIIVSGSIGPRDCII